MVAQQGSVDASEISCVNPMCRLKATCLPSVCIRFDSDPPLPPRRWQARLVQRCLERSWFLVQPPLPVFQKPRFIHSRRYRTPVWRGEDRLCFNFYHGRAFFCSTFDTHHLRADPGGDAAEVGAVALQRRDCAVRGRGEAVGLLDVAGQQRLPARVGALLSGLLGAGRGGGGAAPQGYHGCDPRRTPTASARGASRGSARRVQRQCACRVPRGWVWRVPRQCVWRVPRRGKASSVRLRGSLGFQSCTAGCRAGGCCRPTKPFIRSRSSSLTWRMSMSERTTRGVMITNSSVRLPSLTVVPKRLPNSGRACKTGMPDLVLLLFSWISPPITMDSPERTDTLLDSWRCRKARWLVPSSLAPTSVTDWSICMLKMLPAFTEGVTTRLTPVSLYSMLVLVTVPSRLLVVPACIGV